MGAIRRIISRFTSGGGRSAGRTGSATRSTGGVGGAGGAGGSSQDAKIGRAVRTAVSKLTGKR